jgi:hypothetical protein
MQGNCTSSPPALPAPQGPPLLPLRPGQCVLLTDKRVFESTDTVQPQSLWIANLYLRALSDPDITGEAPSNNMVALFHASGKVWLDNVVFQGQGGYWHGILINETGISAHMSGVLATPSPSYPTMCCTGAC